MSNKNSSIPEEEPVEDWESLYLENVIDAFHQLKKVHDDNLMFVMMEKNDSCDFVEFVKKLK